MSRLIHHVFHIHKTALLLGDLEGLLDERVLRLEQRLSWVPRPLAVEEGAKVQEIR
eukprot:CAMPEP_0203982996 /NCGR_PEP_ID=MMETSP0360-20130528/3481_1 /ASSEMBLY_ACC=CAM_ASM_000342 /TAXON_ID=268821 /ORGANISM="Scrippsiella Hangoei, Strain SHTV-5" /LENGTH=55 /DNA_ID=CAMNT_0050921847 /DNA_START=118 /DNA_END=281 /DNA_ORIENTATION=-